MDRRVLQKKWGTSAISPSSRKPPLWRALPRGGSQYIVCLKTCQPYIAYSCILFGFSAFFPQGPTAHEIFPENQYGDVKQIVVNHSVPFQLELGWLGGPYYEEGKGLRRRVLSSELRNYLIFLDLTPSYTRFFSGPVLEPTEARSPHLVARRARNSSAIDPVYHITEPRSG